MLERSNFYVIIAVIILFAFTVLISGCISVELYTERYSRFCSENGYDGYGGFDYGDMGYYYRVDGAGVVEKRDIIELNDKLYLDEEW